MIDLHMHSTFSDGKDDIEKLINNVKGSGIDFFALTDHDTALGCRTILQSEALKKKIKDLGLEFVVGAEFTCIYNDTYEIHILAYDFDPFAPEVAALEQEMSDILKEKDVHRFNYLEKKGYALSEDSMKFLKSRLNIRKLDLANCLVNDGYFSDVEEAIQSCLEHVEYPRIYRLDAVKVVETMSKIGAKMVWAHSLHGLHEDPITFEEVDQIVSELKPRGLAGLECFYSLYNKEEIYKLVDIAKKHDLFITCGSDYHGKNKTVALAEMSSDGTPVDESLIKVRSVFKNIL